MEPVIIRGSCLAIWDMSCARTDTLAIEQAMTMAAVNLFSILVFRRGVFDIIA